MILIAFNMRAQDVDSLAGKVLRINPLTRDGFSDNPFLTAIPGAIVQRFLPKG